MSEDAEREAYRRGFKEGALALLDELGRRRVSSARGADSPSYVAWALRDEIERGGWPKGEGE